MKRKNNNILSLFGLLLIGWFFSSAALGISIGPVLAKTTVTGADASLFNSVTMDSGVNNIYVVGKISGNGSFNFGNGVTVAGTNTNGTKENVVLVKYSSAGDAQWAKSVTAGSDDSMFNSVAIDASGNIYAVGHITGSGTYNFGNGVTVAGTNSYYNIVIVKYDNSGNAQWAKSVTTSSWTSEFYSVAVDSSGNVYAVGYVRGNGTYNFGNGVTVAGTEPSYWNAIIVKYNNSGNAQWAKSVTTGPSSSGFNSVAVDNASGNVYVAGYIAGTSTFNFGGVTVAGSAAYWNPVLVKYNSSGTAQWAKSAAGAGAATNHSELESVAVDTSGNVYVTGYIGNATYDFGNGATVTGTYSYNPALVKYNSSGTAQWARPFGGYYSSVVVDGSNNIYVGSGPIIKYDSAGNIQWTKDGTNSTGYTRSIATSADGLALYMVGDISGTGVKNFGNGVTAQGSYSGGSNALVLKYTDIPPTVAAISKTSATNITLTASDFIGSYQSSLSNDLNKIKFTRLPNHGILKLSGIAVTVNQEISISSIGSNLVYTPDYGSGTDDFDWNGSDGVMYASNSAGVNVAYGYQQPILTKIAKSGSYGGTIAFTASDFTSKCQSSYGTNLVKIKITSLPSHGLLKLSGSTVTVNQEILLSDLGNLVYNPPSDYSGSESFTWNGYDGFSYASSNANVDMSIAAPASDNNGWIVPTAVVGGVAGATAAVAAVATTAGCVFYYLYKTGVLKCLKKADNALGVDPATKVANPQVVTDPQVSNNPEVELSNVQSVAIDSKETNAPVFDPQYPNPEKDLEAVQYHI